MRKLRYPPEELARRGDLLYDREVGPRATPEQIGQVVAIDVDSGDYEIARDTIAAAHRLFDRKPDAQIWFRRVGFPYLHRHLSLRANPPKNDAA
jgi:hypothetical protein